MQYHYISDKELYHYGRSKKDGAKVGSGRYPLGSGKNGQRQKDIKDLKTYYNNRVKTLTGAKLRKNHKTISATEIYDRNFDHNRLHTIKEKQTKFHNQIDVYQDALNKYRDSHKKEIYDEIKKKYDGDDRKARLFYEEDFWDVSEDLAIKDKSFSKVYNEYEKIRSDYSNEEEKLVRDFLKEEYDTPVSTIVDLEHGRVGRSTLGKEACFWVFGRARDY